MAESSHAETGWTRVGEVFRKNRTLWWTAGAIFLTALVIVTLWKVPQWQVGHVNGLTSKEWFDRANEARKTLATILGGIVLLAGAYFTWRNIKLTQKSVATAQKALLVSQEGQLTDRFTKAIEQLGAVDASGKKKLEVRLGGIYALERIAYESERDHWPIMEVLSTYVRENAPRKPQESRRMRIFDLEEQRDLVVGYQAPPEDQAPTMPPLGKAAESAQGNQISSPRLAADIQAVLTVLGRRDREHERATQVLDLTLTDIRGANLIRANLGRTNFIGADLTGASLVNADLSGAKLQHAELADAHLIDANLSGAKLSQANLGGARLFGANLSKARLIGANLSTARLGGAVLHGAALYAANLGDVRDLTQEQLDTATGDNTTRLPENLHIPDRWR